ncbi:thioredoxin-like protein [Pyronema omphalodes]|nr:thioredoxin-like protein [Pyronema omphalodes]
MPTEILTQAEFDNITQSAPAGRLTVIDCYATWCGPCSAVAPRIAQFEALYTDVKFFKLDIDKFQELATTMDIRAMPTFFFYVGSEKVDEVVGANTTQIQAKIEKYSGRK